MSDQAYDDFAEYDCPELREIIAVLQVNPFTDGATKFAVPEQPGRFFSYRATNEFVYKFTYTIDVGLRRITVLATRVQRLPGF